MSSGDKKETFTTLPESLFSLVAKLPHYIAESQIRLEQPEEMFLFHS